MDLFYSGIQV